jgi:hypothetical protein
VFVPGRFFHSRLIMARKVGSKTRGASHSMFWLLTLKVNVSLPWQTSRWQTLYLTLSHDQWWRKKFSKIATRLSGLLRWPEADLSRQHPIIFQGSFKIRFFLFRLLVFFFFLTFSENGHIFLIFKAVSLDLELMSNF